MEEWSEKDIEEMSIPIKYGSRSIVGVGRERPCSFGNYFDIRNPTLGDVRVANMWYENLEHAQKTFLYDDKVNILLFSHDDMHWCLIHDDRIPDTYYIDEDVCFTGDYCPPYPIVHYMLKYVGAPEEEFLKYG